MTLTPSQKFIARIMRRIHAIWFVKRALPVLLLEIAAIGLCVAQFAQHVHVASVFRNIAASGTQPMPLMQFMFDAFLATDYLVEGVVAGAIVAAVLFVRSTSTSIRKVRTPVTVTARNFSATSRVTLP